MLTVLRVFRPSSVPRRLQTLQKEWEVLSSTTVSTISSYDSYFTVRYISTRSIANGVNGTSGRHFCNISNRGIVQSSSLFCPNMDTQFQGCRGLPTYATKIGVESPKMNTSQIITVPVQLRKRLEKKMIREGTRGHKRQKIIEASRKGRRSETIIHCKHPDLNHCVGQTYPRDQVTLASKGWGHRKAAGDWFTIRPIPHSAKHGFLDGSESTFEDLGVTPNIIKILEENKAMKPTLIQEIAIPEVLRGSNNLIAAETGCGKTLAYLIPVVQQILLEKRGRRKRGVNQPFSIVLVPSRELADQIHYVATKLTEGMDIKVAILQGGNLASKISSPPAALVDILISTVNVASVLTSAGVYNTRSVEHVILDEADTLLDDSFSPDVLAFLRKFPFFPTKDKETQLTLVSATMPRSVESLLDEIVPLESLNRISTPALHRVLSHVPQTFLRVSKSSKPDKLLKLVESDVKNNIPVMIFCNKTSTCDWMQIFLRENQINSIKVHGETLPVRRKGLLNKYQFGDVNVMICTDLGSRGIDSVRTGHVINYEFPKFLADYIHRCGRTGRVGAERKGQVTNFVTGTFEVSVVNEIEMSVRKDLSLPKVNANIKRILSSRYGMFQPIVPVDEDKK